VKGKPWTVAEEKQLKELVEAELPINVIAAKLGRQPDAIMIKCRRLKLEVVVARGYTTTTSIKMPKELPSVEEALKMLAGALRAACKPGLDKVEVQRLQVVATLARTYEGILARYVNYCGIESRLARMEEDYGRLLGEKSKNVASAKGDVAVSAAGAP
jgi:hypothetical protein